VSDNTLKTRSENYRSKKEFSTTAQENIFKNITKDQVGRMERIVVIPLFCSEDGIAVVILNSPLIFPTNNPNNISTIRNDITFLLSSR
jgi:hypothetical protein